MAEPTDFSQLDDEQMDHVVIHGVSTFVDGLLERGVPAGVLANSLLDAVIWIVANDESAERRRAAVESIVTRVPEAVENSRQHIEFDDAAGDRPVGHA